MKYLIAIWAVLAAFPVSAQEPLQGWRAGKEYVSGKTWSAQKSDLSVQLDDNAVLQDAVSNQPAFIRLTGDGKTKGGLLISQIKDANTLPQESVTVEAWVRIHKPLKWGGILSASQDNGNYERGFILGYHESNFYFGVAGKNSSPQKITYLNSTTPWQPGEWYHVVASYDGKTQRLYVDGRPAGSSNIQIGPILYAKEFNLAMGAYWDKDEKYSMHGDIESVRIWDKALTGEQVATRFQQGKSRFPGIEPPASDNTTSTDWLTHDGDNQRSGRSGSVLPTDLSLHWAFIPSAEPREAWPGTAQSDFWRKRNAPEKKRITFDKAFAPVSAGGRVYFGSSSDDQLYCLDLNTGKHLWSFFAGGPIRLAPTIVGDQVIFGCDDGYVYSVHSQSGELQWKSGVPEVSKEHLPGNSRMISLYPIRTGILVRDQTAYFGCGLFPKNAAAWYCSLDIRTGKIIDRKPLEKSLQGYLVNRDGRIFAPTGRDPSGAFVDTLEKKQQAKGKPATLAIISIPKDYPYSFVTTPTQGVGGGDGKVAMLSASDGSVVWEAKVPGIARELGIANGRLIVSTEEGKILCFGKKRDAPAVEQTPSYQPNIKLDSSPADLPALKKLLPHLNGYALVLDADADGGKLVHRLASHTGMQVIGLVKDNDSVEPLRRAFAAVKSYGTRVSIYVTPQQIPYRKQSFNLITTAGNSSSLSSSNIQSLLRPTTGITWMPGSDKPVFHAPKLKGAGEWTHMYADPGNTACSNDTRVGSALTLQWYGRPGPQHIIDRHLRPTPPLVKNGILITPGNNYIIATDGWNGTVLWEKVIPDMRRIGALRDSGNTVLTDDLLYCASGSNCLALDTYTGEEKLRLKPPPGFSSETHEWGYLSSLGSGLIGSAVKKGTVLREMSPAAIYSGGYGDNTTIACSDALFVMDRHSSKLHWTYSGKGAIFNPSITISNKRMFFLESRNPESLKKKTGRLDYPELLEKSGADIVCLHLITGKEIWRQPLPNAEGIQTLFLIAKDNQLIICNSRNHKAAGAKAATVHYDVRCYDAPRGKLRWEQTRDHKKRPNSDHGEQDLHPAIVGDQVIAEPHIYDLKTGKEVGKFDRQGYGCGTISASALSLYFRAGNIATFDLGKQKKDTITSVNRSGCWINMIPASGLLLVPEGSSGCICNFAIQGSMGFAPSAK